LYRLTPPRLRGAAHPVHGLHHQEDEPGQDQELYDQVVDQRVDDLLSRRADAHADGESHDVAGGDKFTFS